MNQNCEGCKKITGGVCDFCLNYTIELDVGAKPRYYIQKYELEEGNKGMWQYVIKERVPVY